MMNQHTPYIPTSARRSSDPANSVRIGLSDGVALVHGSEVSLTPQELVVCATVGLNVAPIAVDELLDKVWSGRDLDRARASLKVYVHRIRRRIGWSAINTTRERIWLAEHVTFDILAWRKIVRLQCGPSLIETQREALLVAFQSLLAGPAPCLTRSNLGQRLDGIYAEALQQVGGRLIDDALACRDLDRAAGLARSAIAVDPYGDRWHEALIRAQILSGDRAAARSTLRRYQTALSHDLGEPVAQAIVDLLTKTSMVS